MLRATSHVSTTSGSKRRRRPTVVLAALLAIFIPGQPSTHDKATFDATRVGPYIPMNASSAIFSVHPEANALDP